MNTELPAFSRQEVKISVNGPHNKSVVPPTLKEIFLYKRKVYVMGPILHLPGEGKSLSSVYSFFTLNRDLTDLHTGSAPEARKGDWLTGSGRCVNKALGRHSRSLECLFRGIRDRATRSEVKCSSYTSWIIKVKNTDSSKEFKFIFSAGLSLPAM